MHVLIQCTTNSPHFTTCTYILGELGIHGGPCSNLVPSPHQRTPLHMAAEESKEGTAQFLVEKGADIKIKDNDGVRE